MGNHSSDDEGIRRILGVGDTKDKLPIEPDAEQPANLKRAEDDRIEYETQRARAEIRESVRAFIQGLEKMRDKTLSYEGKRLASINLVLRYSTLSHDRLVMLKWFGAIPIIVFVSALSIEAWQNVSVFSDYRFAENQPVYVAIVVTGFMVGAILALFRINYGLKDHKTSANLQLHHIEEAITQRMADLQKEFSAAQNAFKVEASPHQNAAPFKNSIIDMFRYWREIERIPIYLRHDFDEYFNEVSDDRNFGFARISRLLIVIAFSILVSLSVTNFAMIVIQSGDAVAYSTATHLSILYYSIAAYGMFGSLSFLQCILQHRGSKLDVFYLILSVAFIAFCLFCGSTIVSADANYNREFVTYASAFFAGFLFVSLLYLLGSGEIYKRFADYLMVGLLRALRTHKKVHAIKLTRRGFSDWTKNTQGDVNDWNGWTPGYEERAIQKLVDQGVDYTEATIRVACDPVIYVGNEKNRRLQAAGTDLVSGFYKKLPVVRQ